MGPGKKKALAPEAPAEVLPAGVTDKVIDEVYEEIQNIHRESLLHVAVATGRIVVERFFGGDLEAWQERGPKDTSFRKLAAKFGEGDLSASGLHRAVNIYALDQKHGVSGRKHLTATHVRALIGLSDQEAERLIRHTEKNDWSAKKLETEATKARKKENTSGAGRPPLPAFVKTIRHLGKLNDAKDDSFGDMDDMDQLDADTAAELYQTIIGTESRLGVMKNALKIHLANLEK